MSKPVYTIPGRHSGLMKPGNIDLSARPVVHNADGSVSTVRSISIGVGAGREVLIPTVINGRVVSTADAIAYYQRTGQNLGTFVSPAAANAYAGALHQQQAKEYVAPERHLTSAQGGKAPDTTALVGLARQYLGTPYAWGGSTPKTGFDCSGFVQWLYGQQGVQLPRVTYDQVRAGVPVAKGELQAGDIVFFEPSAKGPGHEGLYVGGGKFIEAPHTGANIRVSDLAGRGDYVTARRVVPAEAPPLHTVAKAAVEKPPQTATPAASPQAPKQDDTALAALIAQNQFQPPPADPAVPHDHPSVNPDEFQVPLAAAQQHVLDTGNFDTAAFARAVHETRGVPIPQTMLGQAAHGQSVSTADAQPGDLLFFGSNGVPAYQGIHTGRNTFVHGNGTIRLSTLADPRYSSSLLSVRRP